MDRPLRPRLPRRAARLSRVLGRVQRLARVLLASQYATMLEYRAEIALWALSGVLPFIMLGVWSGVEAMGGASVTGGLDGAQLSRYFVAAFLVRQFTIVWVIHSFEEDALEGKLAAYLLQPLAPVWRYYCAHLAEQATRLPFVLLILTIVILLRPSALPLPGATALLAGLMATHLVFAVRFVIQYAITTLCFWSERASALERLQMIPYLFLSGLVAPLEAYPEPVRRFAMATPFPYMIHFPAQLLAGNPVDVAGGFLALTLWGLLLLPLSLLLWRAGLRRYSAMGS